MSRPVEELGELKLLAWDQESDFTIGQSGSTSYREPETGASLRSNFRHPLYRALRDAAPEARIFGFDFLRGASVASVLLAGEPSRTAATSRSCGCPWPWDLRSRRPTTSRMRRRRWSIPR